MDYTLFFALAKAISMSSFVSCSVSGLSPSCTEKSGSRFASLRACVMMSVYLVFFMVGLISGAGVWSSFPLSWKCGLSHFQRSYPQSMPYFLAISATARHFFSSAG